MWMKIDDRLHAHRKTRAVTRSHPEKRRDIAPMGLWVAAGSWSAQNATDGWVPEEELDRWDDDWAELVNRLVRAGYWWPHERDGEPGYGFTDWHDYNDPADMASKSGTYGNHVRWHVNEKRVDPECQHCPKEPVDHPDIGGDVAPDSGGDRGAIMSDLPQDDRGESGGDSRFASGAIALPEPEPDPNPTRTPSSRASADAERMFEEWWSAYPRKRSKGQALRAYKAALKKTDAGTLLSTLRQQIPTLTKEGPDYTPYPATWLNGCRWLDQPDVARPAARLPEARDLEQPPDGLSPAEYAAWEREARMRRAAR
jgi:hypothetical protein